MEIPEKPKCSNIEENYPTDHIRPAEVMDENDPPVYENTTGKPKQEDSSYKDDYLGRIADSLEKIEEHLELIADVKGREWDSR